LQIKKKTVWKIQTLCIANIHIQFRNHKDFAKFE
jgi:hypothetical protein